MVHQTVIPARDSIGMLAYDSTREVAGDLEAVDLEGQRNPAVDSIKERAGGLLHLGAVVQHAVRGHGVKVICSERHDGIEILCEEGASIFVIPQLQLASNGGRI